jgi:hypothetical protein
MATKPHSVHPKVNFTPQEDILLRGLVSEFGDNNWAVVSSRIPGRNARQCKDRWVNYLSPEVTPLPWSAPDDKLLLEKVQEFGRRWVRIAEFFPMRTDVHVKNRYVVLERKQNKESVNKEKKSTPKTVFPSLCSFELPEPLMIPPFATLIPSTEGERFQQLEPQRKVVLPELRVNFDLPDRSENPSTAWNCPDSSQKTDVWEINRF